MPLNVHTKVLTATTTQKLRVEVKELLGISESY